MRRFSSRGVGQFVRDAIAKVWLNHSSTRRIRRIGLAAVLCLQVEADPGPRFPNV